MPNLTVKPGGQTAVSFAHADFGIIGGQAKRRLPTLRKTPVTCMNGGFADWQSVIIGHTNDDLLSRNHYATALQVTSVVKSKIRVFMEYEWDENKAPQGLEIGGGPS